MRKIYGYSQESKCPFCSKAATTKNKQKVPVCRDHTNSQMQDIKCLCKSWMSIKTGKYGAFYLCDKCGPINLNRAAEIKEVTMKEYEKTVEEELVEEKSPIDNLLNTIRNLDKGDGVDIEELLKLKGENSESLISTLLKEGELFELKPGRIKVLE